MKQAATNLQGSLPWSCHPGIGGLAIKIIAWKPLQWLVTLFLIKKDLWCSWPKIGDTRRKKRPPLMTRDGAAECNLSQTGLYIIFSLKQLTCAHFFRLCNSSSAKGKTWQVSIWRAAAGSLHQSSPHLLRKKFLSRRVRNKSVPVSLHRCRFEHICYIWRLCDRSLNFLSVSKLSEVNF